MQKGNRKERKGKPAKDAKESAAKNAKALLNLHFAALCDSSFALFALKYSGFTNIGERKGKPAKVAKEKLHNTIIIL